jgi:hypothetical protein
MKKNLIILIATALALGLSAFKVISAEDSSGTEAKSVAWYVANIKEARTKNQQCHDDPSLQSSADCSNAQHALEITFKGGN